MASWSRGRGVLEQVPLSPQFSWGLYAYLPVDRVLVLGCVDLGASDASHKAWLVFVGVRRVAVAGSFSIVRLSIDRAGQRPGPPTEGQSAGDEWVTRMVDHKGAEHRVVSRDILFVAHRIRGGSPWTRPN